MNRNGPSRKSQPYLVLSKFGYRFRLSVPQDLRAIVGKTEFRYSLRTCSVAEAKSEARRMAGCLQAIFWRVRTMKDLSESDVKRLVESVRRKDMPLLAENAVRIVPLDQEEHAEALREARESTETFNPSLSSERKKLYCFNMLSI